MCLHRNVLTSETKQDTSTWTVRTVTFHREESLEKSFQISVFVSLISHVILNKSMILYCFFDYEGRIVMLSSPVARREEEQECV